MMQEQLSFPNQNKITLTTLIDTIEFAKSKKKKVCSQTQSISSNPSSHTLESDAKEKSKVWTEEETELLQILVTKFGTDFHILSSFFPKKTKNQIKNKYKQLMAIRKKVEKAEDGKLMAVAKMFQQVQQQNQKEEQG